jgi:hypothetical protein
MDREELGGHTLKYMLVYTGKLNVCFRGIGDNETVDDTLHNSLDQLRECVPLRRAHLGHCFGEGVPENVLN